MQQAHELKALMVDSGFGAAELCTLGTGGASAGLSRRAHAQSVLQHAGEELAAMVIGVAQALKLEAPALCCSGAPSAIWACCGKPWIVRCWNVYPGCIMCSPKAMPVMGLAPGSGVEQLIGEIREVIGQWSTCSWLEASTITRNNGSVPEARTNTRPSSPMAASAAAMAVVRASHCSQPLRRSRSGTRTLRKRWGTSRALIHPIRQRLAGLQQCCELQRGQHAITTHAVIGADDVTGLLAAQHRSEFGHGGVDVLITHGGAFQLTAPCHPGPLKTEVAHHRGHKPLLRQGIGVGEGRAPEVKDVIAITKRP